MGITTGYKISYTGTSSSGSENVNGSSMSTVTHSLVLTVGTPTLYISILGTATGVGLPSLIVAQIDAVGLGEPGTILSIGYI